MDSVLSRTSRTFALSLQLLPPPMRRPVELAYLLARAADTIADTELVSAESRIETLAGFRRALAGSAAWGGARPPSPVAEEDSPEAILLARLPKLFSGLTELEAADRQEVIEVVDRLASTMEGELRWFGTEALGSPQAWPDQRALAAYTEGIAGCVGAYWTRLISRHAVRLDPARQRSMTVLGRRYGRGLQLVNILRDLPRDLRRGRCYLPASELEAHGLNPADLLDPGAEPRARPLIDRWEARARFGLLGGLVYAQSIPWWMFRLRAATALPAVLGWRTVVLCRRNTAARLDPGTIIRLTRREVRHAAGATVWFSWRPRSLARCLWRWSEKPEKEVL